MTVETNNDVSFGESMHVKEVVLHMLTILKLVVFVNAGPGTRALGCSYFGRAHTHG